MKYVGNQCPWALNLSPIGGHLLGVLDACYVYWGAGFIKLGTGDSKRCSPTLFALA